MTPGLVPVFELDDVFTAQMGKLSCTALRLVDGSLCVYSPVAGLETCLLAQAGERGAVSALLAPNHYHNKGLAAHVDAFPDAELYCSAAAAPRLTKITGLNFNSLEGLRGALGHGQVLHEPNGLKTGEVWVEIASPAGCALAVADAFSSPMQSPGEACDRVTMLGTFPRYGIKDSKAYKTWASDMLSSIAPTILLPCHGSPLGSQGLLAQLIKHLDELT